MAPATTSTAPTVTTSYFSRSTSGQPTDTPPVYNPHAHQDFSTISPAARRAALSVRADIAQARKARAEEMLRRAEAGLGPYSQLEDETLPAAVAASPRAKIVDEERPAMSQITGSQEKLDPAPRTGFETLRLVRELSENAPMGYYDEYDLERAKVEWRGRVGCQVEVVEKEKKKRRLGRGWLFGLQLRICLAIFAVVVFLAGCLGAYVGVTKNLGQKVLDVLEPGRALVARGMAQQMPTQAARYGSGLHAQH